MHLLASFASSLRSHGVDDVFGLIGNANLFLVEHLIRGEGVRYVGATHEAGAIAMADGYARATGRLGVATVTHGPALTNALTPLVEATRHRTPLLLLTGSTPATAVQHSQRLDLRAAVAPTGAGFATTDRADRALLDLAIAIRRAHAERRPIVFDLPIDLHEAEVGTFAPPAVLSETSPAPAAAADDALDIAVGIIAAARRPIVLAGRGAVGARTNLLALAERTGALVATTLLAKGLFRGEPHDLGVFGTLSTSVASELIGEADCIVAFGAGLNRHTTAERTLLDGKAVVQCDSDADALDRWFRPDATLLGDAGSTADAIVRWLDRAAIEPTGFRDEAKEQALANHDPRRELVDRSGPGTVDLHAALLELDSLLPTNRTLAIDAGRFFHAAFRHLDVPEPSALVLPIDFGSIGLGVPAAVGAAIGRPDRPAVAVVGDGGFMLGGLGEFNTAVRHDLDLIVVVCNDGSYGAEHIQLADRGLDTSLAQITWPELAPLADALGGQGTTVRGLDELRAIGHLLEGRSRPILIDVKMDPASIGDGR